MSTGVIITLKKNVGCISCLRKAVIQQVKFSVITAYGFPKIGARVSFDLTADARDAVNVRCCNDPG